MWVLGQRNELIVEENGTGSLLTAGWLPHHSDPPSYLSAFGPLGEDERVCAEPFNPDSLHQANFGEHLCPGWFRGLEGSPVVQLDPSLPRAENLEGNRPACAKHFSNTIIAGVCSCAPPHGSQSFPGTFSSAHPHSGARWAGRGLCCHVIAEETEAPRTERFPGGSAGKESACNAGPSSIPGSGGSSGEGIGYPLQYSWASLVAQLVKNPPAMRRHGFNPWVGKIPWRREGLPTPVFWPGEFHGLYLQRVGHS